MSNKYKTKKVFDCQDMPKEVRDEFFKTCGSPSFRGGNDCLVEVLVHDERRPISLLEGHKMPTWLEKLYTPNGQTIYKQEKDDGLLWVYEKGHKPVEDWLFENGAKIGETVIVKHWW